MEILTFDYETTTHASGNPFSRRNKAVCLGRKINDGPTECIYDLILPNNWLQGFLLVGFNLKFDLHWARRNGAKVDTTLTVWDCQLAEFILSGQTIRFPSLEDTTVKYGLGSKYDVVKNEFWNKGIDTDQIPREILSEYCIQDVDLTYQVYLKQLELFKQKPLLFKLFKLQCQDLLVLEEMEWNGLQYDLNLCIERSEELTTEITKIQTELSNVYPGISINFGSNDQLSAFLYGGTIYEEGKELVGTYKTGAKAGLPKYKNVIKEHQLPRLVTPLKNSELQKGGVFQTNEPTLQKLRGPAAKKYVAPLLRLAELSKLVGTYYGGLPKLCEKKDWPEEMIYGQFNQCVAATGRLSSSDPNLQNMAGHVQDILTSRFNNERSNDCNAT